MIGSKFLRALRLDCWYLAMNQGEGQKKVPQPFPGTSCRSHGNRPCFQLKQGWYCAVLPTLLNIVSWSSWLPCLTLWGSCAVAFAWLLPEWRNWAENLASVDLVPCWYDGRWSQGAVRVAQVGPHDACIKLSSGEWDGERQAVCTALLQAPTWRTSIGRQGVGPVAHQALEGSHAARERGCSLCTGGMQAKLSLLRVLLATAMWSCRGLGVAWRKLTKSPYKRARP